MPNPSTLLAELLPMPPVAVSWPRWARPSWPFWSEVMLSWFEPRTSAPCRDIVQCRLAAVRTQVTKLRSVEARLVEVLREGDRMRRETPCRHLTALA